MSVKYVSEEVKEALKKEHGEKLKSVIIPLDDDSTEEIEILVVVPSRAVAGQALRFISSDPKKYMEILVKNCVVTDKELIMGDDALFFSTAPMIAELLPIRQGKFGKV
ncbi:hypothetical protein [Epilithonimonas mollis]|uniref:Uncharacterized protein n=1 Tax=Epilithonimonas mollis TaxID=216903 RepID=A0A1M6UKG3_9FLAO|nr:hypothetical protein [Epilithonimonas mollis]SHK69735.1 hypothetical protein SAMN05444371_3354 [Epilithonimonas mollis]